MDGHLMTPAGAIHRLDRLCDALLCRFDLIQGSEIGLANLIDGTPHGAPGFRGDCRKSSAPRRIHDGESKAPLGEVSDEPKLCSWGSVCHLVRRNPSVVSKVEQGLASHR